MVARLPCVSEILAIISAMITYILAIIPGLLCGMLVNYLADVLPLRRKLTRPFCIACDTTQTWRNYLLWPRQCPTCQTKRGLRVWIVEIFFVIASVWMSYSPPAHIGYGLGMVVLAYFGVVVVIDLEYRLILHPVSIFGVFLGLVVGTLRGIPEGPLSALTIGAVASALFESLLGGLVGFGIMWLIYQLGVLIIKLVNRMRGQPVNDVALGFGDVNLSGVLGLMLGFPLILVGLVVAVLVGGLVSLLYILFMLVTHRYQAFAALPYGPFLIIGAVVLVYFQNLVLMAVGG
jgi:leader peptidase (prepilin peptidase) / N-methyltransferase